MFFSILLQVNHYAVIQKKIIDELESRENFGNNMVLPTCSDSQINVKSEEIMRDLFRYWNTFVGDGNEIHENKSRDIINKVLSVKIDNFNDWLEELLGPPQNKSRNRIRYAAYEYLLCSHLKDGKEERRNIMNKIFNCLKQIHECETNSKTFLSTETNLTKLERDQLQTQKELLNSLMKNFIDYMIRNKNDYLLGFRKSMNDVEQYIQDDLYTAKEQQFKDLEFLLSTQVKFLFPSIDNKSCDYHDFEKFKEIASSHAFFQPYFIGKLDHSNAKVDIDMMIEKIVNDPVKNKSEKVDKVIKLFEENTDIYFTSYGGSNRQYDERYYQIFLDQKRRFLNCYLELADDDRDKTIALAHLTDTAYDWAMTLYNVGETTDNMSEYKNLKNAIGPIKEFLNGHDNVNFNSEILKITNFEYELEKEKDKIIVMPRFYNKLAEEIGEKVLYAMLHPNGKGIGRPYWDSNVNELVKFIYMRLKHINEIFNDTEVVRVLKITKDTPIVLKKIQLSLFFMDVFPELMPVLLKIKDKFKYVDPDSDEMFILHTDGDMFKMKMPGKRYDPVRLETVADEKRFLDNLIERANCAIIEDGSKEITGREKLATRLKVKDSPKIEPARRMAAQGKWDMMRGYDTGVSLLDMPTRMASHAERYGSSRASHTRRTLNAKAETRSNPRDFLK